MPFSKETASIAGRKSRRKGVKNKKTAFVETFIKYLLDENIERFKEEMDKLPPKEFLHIFLEFSKICTSITGETIANDYLIELINNKK